MLDCEKRKPDSDVREEEGQGHMIVPRSEVIQPSGSSRPLTRLAKQPYSRMRLHCFHLPKYGVVTDIWKQPYHTFASTIRNSTTPNTKTSNCKSSGESHMGRAYHC